MTLPISNSSYLDKNSLICFLFGVSSGICLLLLGNSYNFWLSYLKIDLKLIGIANLLAFPYLLKFFISPIFEKFSPPFLTKKIGKNKAWIIIIQSILVCLFCLISLHNPIENLAFSFCLIFLVSLFSVFQDIILDGIRISRQNSSNIGSLTSMHVFGYRIGMLISGSVSIYLSGYIGFNQVYLLNAIAIFAIMSLIFIYFDDNEEIPPHKNENYFDILSHALTPFKAYIFILLAFLFLYKIADHTSLVMINPFLLKLGYNSQEISIASKFFGMFSSIIGSLLGGSMINRYGVYNCLFYFALIHSFSFVFLALHHVIGRDIIYLYLTTFYGTFTSGLAMTAYFAFISKLSEGQYKYSRYSFFSSIMGLSRVIIPSFSGFMVLSLDWFKFFIILAIINLISLIFIPFLTNKQSLNADL